MFIGIQKRDRCRICYSLILRDRSALFSSICCQKYYHLFKHIQRTKIPRKKTSLPYQIKLSNRTVCFRDLIYRYLHTEIQSKKSFSNIICYDCSKNLLDIEQCAKYLTQTINKLKRKFNKSNRLVVSSLSATFQKKEQIINHEQLPILNSDDDDEFDDLDGDDDDDEIDDIKSNTKTSLLSNCDSLLDLQKLNRNNGECSGGDDDDDDDEEDDDDDEEGVIKQSQSTKQKHLSTSLTNISNLHDAIDPNNFQLRFAHMMANIAAASSPHQQHLDSFMNTYTNMQRNLLKISTDSGVTDQTTTTPTTDVQIKSNMSPILSQNKQIRSGRKRKSTPEKRVITNNNNNGDTSPTMKNDSINNSSSDNFNNHPLELTIKDSQRSNHMIQNGNSSYQQIDEDHKETMTPNDSSLSLSPLLNRRSTSSKRVRLSTIGQNEHINNLSMVNLSNSTTDLLSPNHQHQIIINDDNHQRQQQRKLEPRPCAECGKILFNDKTHLLHCQTHAKNEKQCWICGKNDDDIKKHILNEHGNQKFTNTGFKCQHCDKVFADFSDLQTHTAEHSKKKPFECPICHKRFGQQGNLSCHLRIHSGVKPFTCTNCGKAFRHSNSLRRHARTVHSASRGLTSTPNSLLVSTTTTSLSNNIKNESSNDVSSGFMMAYDEGSSSTGGIPSPSISNTQIDSD